MNLAKLAKKLILFEHVRISDPRTNPNDKHEVLLDNTEVGQVSLPTLRFLLLLLILLSFLHLQLLDVFRAERLERCGVLRVLLPASGAEAVLVV